MDHANPEQPQPHHDLTAERWLLSAMMNHPASIEAAVETLVPDHFYRPAHQVLYRAIVVMYAAHEPVDPVTVRAWLEAEGQLKPFGDQAPVYLFDLYALHASVSHVAYYAKIIHGHAVRRAIAEAGARLLTHSGDMTEDPVELADRAVSQIGRAVSAARPRPKGQSVQDFLAADVKGGEWVIPGFLGTQERVVIVGPEGAGKTALTHQVGYCAAAGVHPFSWRTAIEPKRILLLDYENPLSLLQGRMRRIVETAAAYGQWDPSRVTVLARPGGVDLTDPRDRYELIAIIRDAAPDLVLAGPVYKMVSGGDDDRKLAAHRQLAAFFDLVRDRYGCAIWLEAHAPYAARERGAMRPEGSNIWAKWPEFGITLSWATKAHGGRNGLDVEPYRGHRAEGRNWPDWLTRNPNGSGWPWVANYAQGAIAEPTREGWGE